MDSRRCFLKQGNVWHTALAVAALGALIFLPVEAEAQKGEANGRGKAKGHSKQHWNAAPPKKNGRHDNRDWNANQRSFSQTRDAPSRTDRTKDLHREIDRRQQTKNEWRNIAYLSGAAAVLGLLNNDRTLVFAGSAGALYSLHRYEQDRKSQSQLQRLRAEFFSRPYFYRDGVRYERVLVTRDGQRYYQFVRR
jgi:hypothetical protein